MSGFLRMKAFRAAASDEEVVRRLRADLPRRPRRRAVMMAVGLACILVGLVVLLLVPCRLHGLLDAREDPSLRRAIAGGVAAGALGALGLLVGVRLLGDVAAGPRRDRVDRMLVDLWDNAADPGPPDRRAPDVNPRR